MKLRAMLRCCKYLHEHIIKHIRAFGNTPDLDPIMTQLHDIDLQLLTVLKLLSQERKVGQHARRLRTEIHEEVAHFVSVFGFRQDLSRASMDERLRHIEEKLDEERRSKAHEEVALERVEEICKGIRQVLETLERDLGHVWFYKHRGAICDYARAWKHFLDDFSRTLRRELELIHRAEQKDGDAARQLEELEEKYHAYYERLRQEHFFDSQHERVVPVEEGEIWPQFLRFLEGVKATV